MSDRELLKRAAKAAGVSTKIVKPFADYDDRLGFYTMNMDGSRVTGQWNPLADDGDALRLAVKLRLNIDFGTHESIPYVSASRHGIEMVRAPVCATESSYEQKISDWDAATRRAIVRAAAEIDEGDES